jgi:bifunctional non-homologous end joining protein LigD
VAPETAPAAAPAAPATPGPTVGRLFVVHKHAARQLHYDLRLEMHGVLESWAVPKGPSRDPREKRLAVKVEDHPLEYGDFEGMIPEGNYGAGAVILWDRGSWVPLEDVDEGFKKGKLLFDLRGYKLRGRWTLVKIKKSEKDWLLIKERDALATEGDGLPEESILSGLTVEELREGADRGAAVRRALEQRGAKRGEVRADRVELMLAETRDKPFSKPGWVFELKLDGFRMLAEVRDGEAALRTRNGRDATGTFPDVIRALRALPFKHVVMDGELVVHDEGGLPSFQRLQRRALLTRAMEVRQAAVELPATFYAFDLLGFEQFDLRPLPLVERKALLKRLLPPVGPVRYLDHVDELGDAFYERVTAMGLEGMVGKRSDGPYRAGRTRDWLKVRADRTGDFAIVGYTSPQGSRGGFGALHLAAYDGGELRYAGRAGSGFSTQQLKEIREALDARRVAEPPCLGAPAGKEHTWVEPRLVCEVRYKEWTEDHLLRQPVFLRMRDDKAVKECEMP